MQKRHTINISEGQTLLLFNADKILLRKKHDCKSSVTTSWDSFVGTDEEVDNKINELSLSVIEKPAFKKTEVKPVEARPKASLSSRFLTFLKTLFSK